MSTSDNYLDEMKLRLEKDLAAIIEQPENSPEFITFLLEEIRASFKRGLALGRSPQKPKARFQKKTSRYKR